MKPLRVLPTALPRLMVLLFAAWSGVSGQILKITVTNPSDFARRNEPVAVDWSDVVRRLPLAEPQHLRLQDEGGQRIQCQVDDMDRDGTPDQLVFAVDIGPRQRRVYALKPVASGETWPASGEYRTDAQDWKRVNGVLQSLDDDDGPGLKRDQTLYRFDGVGWESEVVGYRLYLDERNAVDIQGKRKPGLYWKYIGTSSVDYQQDADWGMDVLHVGPAFGVGGIGFWIGDSVLKPLSLDRRRCQIVSRGPVRAVIRVDYTGWVLGGEKVDATSIFTILAGDRISEQHITLRKGQSPAIIATGIVKNDSAAAVWNGDAAWLYTLGRQSRANDSLLMALMFSPADVIRRTDNASDHLVLLRIEEGSPVTFLIAAVWQGETGTMWDEAQIKEYVDHAARRLKEPLQVQPQ